MGEPIAQSQSASGNSGVDECKSFTEELRACLIDGTVLLQLLNKLRPGYACKAGSSSSENVKKFLASMDELGILNLILCYMKIARNFPRMHPSAASMHHVVHKFHEVFQLKQGRYSDLSAANISEMMKSNSLDNAPTQSLLSVVNGILDESIERKNDKIPHRVACLLRKNVQEIERRISTHQNNLFKVREEKYQLRIRVLEALASGTGEERGVVMDRLQQIKIEKSKMEEEKKTGVEHVAKLIKEQEQRDGRMKELEILLEDSRNQVRVLEAYSQSKSNMFNKKEHIFKSFVEFQFGALKYSLSIYAFSDGVKLKALIDATGDYHIVLAENRRMFNELQELKGNIRVYCQIRPFLPGQAAKHTTVEYIGEHGELAIVNPSKQGKDRRRNFKFNKIFGPESTQETSQTCYLLWILAAESNDKERVPRAFDERDEKRTKWIISAVQPNGLAVPDASMHPVTSTSDVLELIGVGLKNRAVGATAMNERSSRSHSCDFDLYLLIQCCQYPCSGKDLLFGAALHGNLHLVDLAGSERVDRSEATGDRLKEAQHINKSLSALGDVIFSLAQKNSHVPYRNSKLTQLLQSSLGGQAKTLMFVQLNPDFAERVSGVELGAARSSKGGRDVRELMDQLASLKDTIARKDDEIEQLQLIKDHKNEYPGSMRYGDSSASNDSSDRRSVGSETSAYQESIPEFSDKHSEADGDYEDRSSDISDGVPSVVTDPDGATDQSTKLSETFRKSKVASTIRLLQNQTQNASKTVMDKGQPKRVHKYQEYCQFQLSQASKAMAVI
uniref:Kinesin motor domain-containing protein n=1 Tax=Salix viminalis TaxID=40686 RepID=A0A6N2LM92_SALVM